jgi:hypothetical protein
MGIVMGAETASNTQPASSPGRYVLLTRQNNHYLKQKLYTFYENLCSSYFLYGTIFFM